MECINKSFCSLLWIWNNPRKPQLEIAWLAKGLWLCDVLQKSCWLFNLFKHRMAVQTEQICTTSLCRYCLSHSADYKWRDLQETLERPPHMNTTVKNTQLKAKLLTLQHCRFFSILSRFLVLFSAEQSQLIVHVKHPVLFSHFSQKWH